MISMFDENWFQLSRSVQRFQSIIRDVVRLTMPYVFRLFNENYLYFNIKFSSIEFIVIFATVYSSMAFSFD